MNTEQKEALCRRIMAEEPGNLLAHTNAELLPEEGDEMQAAMNQSLRELVLVFSTQGHSGFSANYAIAALEKLLRYEPLRPLTGESAEWVEVGQGVFQNKRCSRVFKQVGRFDGQAYDIEGKVFRRQGEGSFTNHDSFVPITFPYRPTTEYINLPS